MATTNPVPQSIGTAGEDLTIIVAPEGADFIRVKSLDGAGYCAFNVKSVGGRDQGNSAASVASAGNFFLAAAAGDEVVIPLAVRGANEADRTVVLSCDASAETMVVAWADTRTG